MVLDGLGALFCTLALVALAWHALVERLPASLSWGFLAFYALGTTCWLGLGLVQDRPSLVFISVVQTTAALVLIQAKWASSSGRQS